jgi:hypothetical protein
MEVDARSGAENVPPENLSAPRTSDLLKRNQLSNQHSAMASAEPRDRIEALLTETQDPSRVHSAEAELKVLEGQAGFASHMLRLCHPSAPNAGVQLQAATYFRNLVRNHWNSSTVRVAILSM